MKFLFAVLADELVELDYGRYDVKGLQHTFSISEGFSTGIHLTLHTCSRIEIEDQFQEIDMVMKWVDEQTQESVTFNSPFHLPSDLKVKSLAHTVMPLTLPIESEGRHHFDIIFDGEKVGEVPFEVLEREDEPSE